MRNCARVRLATRLGETCNRDAIGARVEVDCEDAVPLTKTLRAGDGFLSQSSKWMHFGLGTSGKIRKVTVRWPGGSSQSFRDLGVDQFYLLRQGTSEPQQIGVGSTGRRWTAHSAPTPKPPTEEAAIFLSSRLPVPRLPYHAASGDAASIDQLRDRPVLINLWASWCLPCQRELQDLTSHATKFRSKGVEVVALSTDGLTGQQSEPSGESVQSIIRRIDGPLRAGRASRALVDRLQFLDDYLFAQKRELAIPTSFLLDAKGRLVAIYRGAVEMPTLFAHIDQIGLKGKAIYDAALPFSGRWYRPNVASIPLRLAAHLERKGHVADAATYLHEHRDVFSRQSGYVTLIGRTASVLAMQKRQTQAIELYRDALGVSPENVALLNNLAWHLATHVDATERNPAEAIQLAERAAKLSDYSVASVIDTLIAAHLSANRRGDAIIACRKAIRVARQNNRAELVKKLREKLAQLEP